MKKTLLAAAALVFVIASPAFAQSYDPDIGTGNLDSWPYTSNTYSPYGAYGFDPSYGAYSYDPSYGAYGYVPYYGAYSYDPYYGAYAPAPGVPHEHTPQRRWER